ncbi:MAG: prepilin peptidase [Pseudomonadota bacterium]
MFLQSCLDLSLLALVCAAGVRDLMVRQIPNRLLAAGLAVALSLHVAAGTLAAGIGGALFGLLLFLPLYVLRGMAAGDVKLMATVGAFTGPALVLHICVASCCIGGVMGIAVVLACGRGRALLANLRALLRPAWMQMLGMPAAPEAMPGPSVGSIPYGLAIALGTLLVLSLRHS